MTENESNGASDLHTTVRFIALLALVGFLFWLFWG